MAKAYLAPEGFEKQLARDLPGAQVFGRLFIPKQTDANPAWVRNIWLDIEVHKVRSVEHALQVLRSKGRQWAPYEWSDNHIAYQLAKKLPAPRLAPQGFLEALPRGRMGAWTMLDRERLLIAPHTSSPFPHGECHFKESRQPPNRAYLKLWELFTVHGIRPARGSRVLDLGASPGGWTWVLSQMGCSVLAVDKAPLDSKLARLESVETLREDAFALKPEAVGPVDWLFSDVICYPDRLLKLVEAWRESGSVKGFVCTLKFQGVTDFKTIDRFRAIKGSKLFHLFHNKHELTWVLPPT